jgi:hypothetical protein
MKRYLKAAFEAGRNYQHLCFGSGTEDKFMSSTVPDFDVWYKTMISKTLVAKRKK